VEEPVGTVVRFLRSVIEVFEYLADGVLIAHESEELMGLVRTRPSGST
jgi:hypothetical protein